VCESAVSFEASVRREEKVELRAPRSVCDRQKVKQRGESAEKGEVKLQSALRRASAGRAVVDLPRE